jgi:Fe-S-cluster containining protein
MTEIERLKQAILDHYPRLSESSSFTFACHPGVPCFNDCCGDVNIFLTPYDIIRMKHSLGVSSGEFLSKYTVSSCDENLKYPIILLRMNDDDKKSCPFVGEDGCRVYEARPWSCRMYPLGLASPMEGCDSLKEEFYFLLEDESCRGFGEEKTQTVAEWLEDQGTDEYRQMGQHFKELTLHEFFRGGEDLAPRKAEMFSLACYDLDRFRGFVLTSTFFDKFEVDAETRKRIEEDDVDLLKLGYSWLRLALFGEETLEIKKSALEAKKKEFAKRS